MHIRTYVCTIPHAFVHNRAQAVRHLAIKGCAFALTSFFFSCNGVAKRTYVPWCRTYHFCTYGIPFADCRHPHLWPASKLQLHWRDHGHLRPHQMIRFVAHRHSRSHFDAGTCPSQRPRGLGRRPSCEWPLSEATLFPFAPMPCG